MLNFGLRIVTVTFLDEATGAVISSSRMPLDRLPERFGNDLELKMNGALYKVVRADPPTWERTSGIKQLKVVLRNLTTVQ